ncbi:MAG TPA: YbaK/EbsC family protein [Planctomycetaceae bacterium]|jgi:prolyl-tRNA editing enzyme YbaK/EbsC (Cys-tRNA(Pro) deacylase)|nr:YbaK/EbsC family protein [Planctomycetaceae bacterium]
MSASLLQSIRDLLTAGGASFREVRHEPTYTSEESARARGEELRIGGKALLLRGDDAFALFVLPADCKIDSGAVRRELGFRKLRFASREELLELTGLVPGSVPPFGRPILPFPLYVDTGIAANDRIAFNAGSLTDSIILSVRDYLRLAAPVRIFGLSDTAGKVDTENR